MNRMIWFVIALIVLGGVYEVAFDIPRERKHRAELHMLDTLAAGFSTQLRAGRPLPTNWVSFMSFDDSVRLFRLAQRFSEHNQLEPPEVLYTFLPRKVTNPVYGAWGGGCTFLVRSKPCRWEGLGLGRWVLIHAPNRPGGVDSNYVSREWWGEAYLPKEVRSQLEHVQ